MSADKELTCLVNESLRSWTSDISDALHGASGVKDASIQDVALVFDLSDSLQQSTPVSCARLSMHRLVLEKACPPHPFLKRL
jgi:hypothetical protein